MNVDMVNMGLFVIIYGKILFMEQTIIASI